MVKKHTVHTKHPRYNVPQYPRGSGGREVNTSPARPKTEGEEETPSNILYNQINSMRREIKSWRGIKQAMIVNDNTLQLNYRGRGNPLNLRIKYNPATDLYDIDAFEVKRSLDVFKVYESDGVFVENLPDVIDTVFLDRKFNRNEVLTYS